MVANFNFCACEVGSLVYGSERPGNAEELNKSAAISPAAVEEWATFMKAQGITRVLCLLNDEELGFYQEPGYVEGLKKAGFDANKISCVNVFTAGAGDKTEAALAENKASGEKLLVHCSGGEGRTGLVLAQVFVFNR